MIEYGLKAFLCAQTNIAALVGDRVSPEIKEQDQGYPSITYSRERTQRNTLFEGQSDFVKAEFQIDAWAESYDDAKLLQNEIRKAMRNFKDGMMDTIPVNRVYLEDTEADVFEHSIEKYRSSQLYSIWFCEA